MKICIPVKTTSVSEAKRLIVKAVLHADYLELWLDEFSQQQSTALIKEARQKAPVIAVCREAAEKGSFKGTEEERIERLIHAVSCGAQYVDCGMQTADILVRRLKRACSKKRAQLIFSKHYWDTTPSLAVLEKLIVQARRRGADIVKIATTVKHWSDNAVLFELTARAALRGQKVIIIGMGERGKISRIGCPLLGSFLTYVALDKKSKTAPGQWTVQELKDKGF